MTDTAPTVATVGLDAAEVADRVARGLVNAVPPAPSRTVGQILRDNLLTRFNLLMGSLLAIVVALRAWRDALFGIVVVTNALIGIVQELRAKRTLDRLAVLAAPHALIVRDGEVIEAGIDEIVLDDVVELRPGNQVVADAEVLVATNLEVDESLLTGESEPVPKSPGDDLLSGSFVVAGGGRAQVTRVGADAYAAQLAAEAKRFTLSSSQLRAAIDRIILWVTWAIVPTGAILFASQLLGEHETAREALISATGGVVAMVPEGLILLTSVAFAVGVVRLARRRTLVQELPAIEVLARVDVVCLDKTGTITEGSLTLASVEPLDGHHDGDGVDDALAAIAWADPNPNATQAALQGRYRQAPEGWAVTGGVPFSSARKWSSTTFGSHGTFVLGAPEVVLADPPPPLAERVAREAGAGRRVLLLARGTAPAQDETLPPDPEPLALVLIEDTLRPDAAETLDYFRRQDVTMKVISGDNPATVAAVAGRAGLADADNMVDARTLPRDDPDRLARAVEATTVFGRVDPHQKQAMVGGLQARGHVVAMTGDGVNDVLALKDADVGIAMAAGSEASRAVAQLVLLDSSFSGLPGVVAEGRRIINNITRVAAVFLNKTVYAFVLALTTGLSGIEYPFLPRHLTLVGSATIGIPGFFLALAPDRDRVRGDFFGTVARVAVPSGIICAATTMTAYLYARGVEGLSLDQERTTATLALTATALVVLVRTARPFVMWKGVLVGAMAALVLAAIVTPWGRRFFELELPPVEVLWVVGGLVAVAAWSMVLAAAIIRRRFPHE